ncbi:MAG: DNA mismatch repair endonuclease MutL [Chitinophagales bacterium]|nr:DNA mismatch repair endonuclease MutL [Chitinophagaceae bacterium]MCB9065343.1 DNA mismatch repair endonuclease MutL [Chitinophagales bacterium]
MPDVIQLLSDHIANQIAAGEVIQRPASAVKEMLENAVDAGATDIQLILKDAGKELIQVVDNGVGMSATDARMSFERHATSKIKNINDLFSIRTMGFRGEALASIAAVAQVELKTMKEGTEVGSRIVIEGTEVKLQEPCGTPQGTSISVKNLFYNVPARRHFLKSNTTEFRHIVDEFTRVALAHPDIAFRLFHNDKEQFHLTAGNLKTRIVDLLGNSYTKNLVPVEEQTELINISGFIGKPEAATRTRGNQFFFINNRFIKSGYLHHALVNAYEGLIDKETFPFYVLFLEIDPARVDVNVHPTKQEVKFEDDRMMYAYLNAAVKHALARYNIAPSIDFTLSPEIQQLSSVQLPTTEETRSKAEKGYLGSSFANKGQAHKIERNDSMGKWKQLYEIANTTPDEQPQPNKTQQEQTLLTNTPTEQTHNILLVQGFYLVTTVKSGLMMVHIRRAQERIWYERMLEQWNDGEAPSQQVLFPVSYELPPQDAMLLNEALGDLARIGFDISPFGKNTFVVQGVPSSLPPGEEKNVLDEVIEQLKNESNDTTNKRSEKLLVNMAKRLSRNTAALSIKENQQGMIDELFACSQPEYTADGKKIFNLIRKEELDKMMDRH